MCKSVFLINLKFLKTIGDFWKSLKSHRILHKLACMNPVLSFQEMRYELAHLAHSCCDIDKFRVETCCVIGRFFIYIAIRPK